MTMLGQNHLFSDPTLTDLSAPGSIFGTGQMGGGDYAVPQQQAPFVWGAGGVKLTPDQLAARQQQATERSKSDYSPVANVWAGLGRVADNALGAWQQKGLDKEYAAQNSVADGLIQGLTSADPAIQQQSVAAALTSGSPIAQKLALQVDARLHPKAQQPGTLEQNYNFLTSKDPTLGNSYLRAEANPQVLGTNPETGALAFYPKGGTPNVAAPTGIPTPKSQAEYDAIPKGATFVDDDGQTKVKG